METTIEYKLREIVAEQIGVRADRVVATAKLTEDLGCDSLDMVELVMAVEEEFKLDLSDPSAEAIMETIRTFGEAVVFLQERMADIHRDGCTIPTPVPSEEHKIVGSTDALAAIWDKYSDDDFDEFLKFDRVQNKLSKRADIHAFLLLDKLVPGDCDMVSAAEHDEIWLDVTPEELSKVVTTAQIIELIRCGVRYDSGVESFAMFT